MHLQGFQDLIVKMKAKIIIWEPINSKFIRACLAEAIAMNFFVVICCGCAMGVLKGSDPNLMMVAAAFGFGIMCLAQFVGPISGGHINCAVSFALFLGGRTSLVRCFWYTCFQMLGSVFGALFLWAIFGGDWSDDIAFGSNAWNDNVFSGGQVFFAEMLGTMLLVYNVFATIDIPAEGGGSLGVYPIAMSVMVAHLFLLPIDGCSINPTRSFGPSLVAAWAGIPGNYYHQQYMFWFAPLTGAAVAAIIYEYGSLKPRRREGAGDMEDAIFMADKKRDAVSANVASIGGEDDNYEYEEPARSNGAASIDGNVQHNPMVGGDDEENYGAGSMGSTIEMSSGSDAIAGGGVYSSVSNWK